MRHSTKLPMIRHMHAPMSYSMSLIVSQIMSLPIGRKICRSTDCANFKISASSARVLLLVLSFAMVILLQACSNVELTPRSEEQLVAKANLDGNICSLPPEDVSGQVNFIFVIDMSGSNIFKSGQKASGTDVPGLRFDVLNAFLDESCLDKYKSKSFAVIGFSDEILNLNGGDSCSKAAILTDVSQVRAEINRLKNIQQQVLDDQLTEQDSRNPMSETYYKKFLDCGNDIIASQLAPLDPETKKGQSYFSFILTDGAPTDNSSLGLNITSHTVDAAVVKFNSFFKPALDRFRQLTSEVAGGGRLQPILYGASELGSDVKLRLAQGVLSKMAERGESQLKSIDEFDQLDLCELIKNGRRQPFTVKKFGVTNLTATMRRGVLYADSDMDGLTDDVELKLGFDASKRRSEVNGNETLDGLCFGLEASQCPVATSCGPANALGLNRCDVAAYSLTDGVDSDADDIPDLVEILKATLPNDNDVLSDVDGDNLPLHEELALGRDPSYFDQGIDSELLISYTHSKSDLSSSECPQNQQSWSYKINYIPLIPVQATENSLPSDLDLEFLNHAENENIILIYYIIKKLNNDANSISFLFGRFMKINYKTREQIALGDFELLGSVDGNF